MDKTQKAKVASEHLEIGKKLFELEALRDSIRNLQMASAMYEKLGDNMNLVESLATLGVAYSADGSEEMAIECFLDALSIASANNFSFQIARLFNNIGSRFLELRETDKAIEYFEKALDALEESKTKPDPRQENFSVVLWMNLAQGYCQKRNPAQASKYLASAKKIVGDDKNNPFYVQMSIVECQFALAKGNQEYIRLHIDEVIDGVSRNKRASDFVQNIKTLCSILQDINDEAHYKWVVLAFETYATSRNTPYLNMVNAQIMADYYRYIGDILHYQEMCVKHLSAYNKYVKQAQKNRAASIDSRIETQGKDYYRFFEKYLANLEEDAKIQDALLNTTDKEDWLAKLQQHSIALSELYVDNENLIERYIGPVLRDEIELDDEIATELLKGIWMLHMAGKTEFRIGVEIALKLEPYFEEKKSIEEHIRALEIIIVSFIELTDDEEAFQSCLKYINKFDAYKYYFSETTNKETQRIMCESYLRNGMVMAEHRDTSLNDVIDIIEKNFEFLEKYNVAKELGMSEERAEYYKNNFTQYIIAAALNFYNEVDPDNKELRRCYELVSEIYEKALEGAADPRRIDEKLYGSYVRLQYLTGEISREECYELHKEYYSYYMIEGKTAGDEHLPEPDQRRFSIMIYYVPQILAFADFETDYDFCDEMVFKYLDYIKTVSNKQYGDVVSKRLCKSLSKVLEYIDDIVTAIEIMTTVIVERDVNLMIHSHMVAAISRLILEMIYRQNCELLIGNLGIIDEVDATEFWPDVADFVENAALIHDLGLMPLSHISRKHTRKISDLEYNLIRRHPKLGADLVRGAEHISPYIPVIEGHHLGWENTKDKMNALIISIIQMADCLDAATDEIGRAYSVAKTSDDVLLEFEAGKGSRYNPELVDMMIADQRFKEELAALTTEGRKDICYNIYINYLVQE